MAGTTTEQSPGGMFSSDTTTQGGIVATSSANSATASGSSSTSAIISATAEQSKIAAEASETAAAASAVTASTKASEAATSASAAATSASGITSSVTASAASATAAQSSEDDAAIDLALTNADVVLTHADVVLTNADVVLTNADVVLAEADKVQTGLDRVATAADKVATNADVVLTNADVVSAEADKVQTGLDRIAVAADLVATSQDTIGTAADVILVEADKVQTGLDRVATAADKVATNADVVLTGADVVLAEADKVQTGLDRIAVAADLVATNQDTIDTAADVVLAEADKVQTGLDRVATAADKVATNADVVLTNADVVLAEADRVSAAASASTATTQASTATTQAATATTKAATATTQAATSTTKASEAATSATASASSATAAATSATASASSATGAASSATAAQSSEDDAATDLGLTNADVVLTHADVVLTNADVVLTHADVVLTNADVVLAEADKVQTGVDRAAVAADLVLTNQDTIDTAADVVLTHADVVLAEADKVQTGVDRAAVAADLVLTNADVVLAEADRVSAAASAATATTKAATATTQATTATTQASTATTKASEAATSASGASTSASSAATSLTATTAAKDATLAALDSFDDRYLGVKGSAPSVDNDGNTLATGALYFDSVTTAMKVWSGSAWLSAYASLSGALIGSNNLSDVSNAGTSRTNLGVAIGSDVQAYTSVLAGTQQSFTSALKTKLDAIEASATADQTNAEIRAAVEAATDSNAFTDADHTKLNAIEASATADQSNTEIRTAVEAATDSNVFTDADHTKLNAIEASADVTDTANVTAAGALMDSELAGIAAVKATTGTFLTADQTKLDGIEASADVTDTANVTSSGALMDSELTNLAAVKAINQSLVTTASPTFGTVTADAGSWSTVVSGNAITFDRNGENNIIADSGSSANLNLTAGNRIFYSADDYQSFKIGSSPTEKLRILSTGINVTGKVGIGLTSPTTNLHVDAPSGTTYPTLGTASGVLGLSINELHGMYLGVDGSSGNGWIQAMREDGTGTSYNLVLQPSGGNVGIGLAGPASKLHVQGGDFGAANGLVHIVQNVATNAPTLFIEQTGEGGNTNNNQGLLIKVDGHNAGLGNIIRAIGTNSNVNGGTDVEAFTVKNSGNATFGGTVGVANGTVALPSLSFAGDTNTGLYRPSSDNLGFAIGGTARAFMSNSQFNVATKIVATELDINGIADISGNATFGGTVTANHPLILNNTIAGNDTGDFKIIQSLNASGGVGYAASILGVNIDTAVNSSNLPTQDNTWGGITGSAAFVMSSDISDGLNSFRFMATPQSSTAGTALSTVATIDYTGAITATGLGIGTTSITDASWGTGNKELAIDGTTGYGVIHLRGTGAGSVDTRYSIGVGDNIFYMAYDDVAGVHRAKINSSKQLVVNEDGSGDKRVWHAGNDGSSSGLDADLLDGQHASAFLIASPTSITIDGTHDIVLGSTTHSLLVKNMGATSAGLVLQGSGGQHVMQLYGAGSYYGFLDAAWADWDIQKIVNGTFKVDEGSGLMRVWNAGNDGSGSGLDADLLDGQQGSYYAPASTYLPLAGGTLTGDLHLGNNVGLTSTTTGEALRVLFPGGGAKKNSGSSETGAIKITLPVGMTNSMLSIKVTVYQYNTDDSFEVHCGGYNYPTGLTWAHNPFGYITSSVKANHGPYAIRFGYDSNSKACIYIGETSTVWSYPQIAVTEAMIGYSAYDNTTWDDGWDVSIATSFENVTHTIAATDTSTVGWHPYNDGSGSGLDSDTVDGVQASSFLRSDVHDTGVGLTINGGTLNSPTDATLYVTASNNNDWGITLGAASGKTEYGMQIQMPSSFNYAFRVLKNGVEHFNVNSTGATIGGNYIYHVGNDGSGSGLDADLLDGAQGASFLRSDATDSAIGSVSLRAGGSHLGNHEFASASSSSTSYGDAGIEIREGAYGATSSYAAPRIGMHWGGVVASNISMDTAGAILIRNNPGTGYENFRANNIYANGTNTVWHVGNDASGSGLDADLLDGQQGSYYMPASTTVIGYANYLTGTAFSSSASGAPGSALEYQQASALTDTRLAPSSDWHNTIRMGHGNPYNYYNNTIAARMTGTGVGDLYTQTTQNNTPGGWRKVWTAGNDGSGSGLDADTVDGIDSASFLRSDTTDTASGQINFTNGLQIEGNTIWNGSDTWCRIPGQTGVYFASYSGGVWMTDTTWVRIYNSKALYVANSIAATGNITAYYSDERLKTKTGKIENALEKVQSLHGFTYVENDVAKSLGYKSEREQVAVSAQDVQRVLPQAVSLAPCDMETDEFSGEITSKSGEDYLTVDYSRLVPLLVEAIKELKEEVNGLKVQLGGK